MDNHFDIDSWFTARSLWQMPISTATEKRRGNEGQGKRQIQTASGTSLSIEYGYRPLRWLDRRVLLGIEALYVKAWDPWKLKNLYDAFYETRILEVKKATRGKSKDLEAIAIEASVLALQDLADRTEIRVSYADLAEILRKPREMKVTRDGSYVLDAVSALAKTIIGAGSRTVDGAGTVRIWTSPFPLLRIKVATEEIGVSAKGDFVASLNPFHLRALLDGNVYSQSLPQVMAIEQGMAGHLYVFLNTHLWQAKQKGLKSIYYDYREFCTFAQVVEYRTPAEVRKQLRDAYDELIERGIATWFEVTKRGAMIEIEHSLAPEALDRITESQEDPKGFNFEFTKWYGSLSMEEIDRYCRKVNWIDELKTKARDVLIDPPYITATMRYLRWIYARKLYRKEKKGNE